MTASVSSSTTATVPRTSRERGVAKAWRAPFFAAKLRAAGLAEGQMPDVQQWQQVPVTTKEELRDLSAEQFGDQLVIATPDEIGMYWRSGGVTGRPLFYPKAKADSPALTESFRRVLDVVGITAADLVHNSFPYAGVHPIGHMFGHALQDLGAGNIFAGSGGNTSTDAQVELLFALKPTAWIGIGSYLTHLGHRAAVAGHDPRSSRLNVAISSAEPLTPAKRVRMESTWGVELYDCYGMTEVSMMGAECSNRNGLHVWTDLFEIEVVQQGTHEPVGEGEQGLLIVTPFHSMGAIPFVRWSPGDIGALEYGCDCGFGQYPRLRLGSRTVGFSKVRGVNINHNDLEDALLSDADIADYMVTVLATDGLDELVVEFETSQGADGSTVGTRIEDRIGQDFEVHPRTVPIDRGTIAARLEGQIKQVRVRDQR